MSEGERKKERKIERNFHILKIIIKKNYYIKIIIIIIKMKYGLYITKWGIGNMEKVRSDKD